MKSLLDHRFDRVLVVAAHMDDESLFCGGTLRRLRDQGCELHIAVTASVEATNAAPGDDRARQQRRLVAFGRACGMLDVERTYLLDARNCHGGYPFDTADYEEAFREVSERLAAVVREVAPSAVITHGPEGEYGHTQHILAARVVRGLCESAWGFSADGPLTVPIDLAFKRRLLGCYRHGTTQDPHWAPYATPPGSDIAPWLGATEGFRPHR